MNTTNYIIQLIKLEIAYWAMLVMAGVGVCLNKEYVAWAYVIMSLIVFIRKHRFEEKHGYKFDPE